MLEVGVEGFDGGGSLSENFESSNHGGVFTLTQWTTFVFGDFPSGQISIGEWVSVQFVSNNFDFGFDFVLFSDELSVGNGNVVESPGFVSGTLIKS